ncbi:MAG TPA: gamma carbonic anhydrase family protein [Acidimicrobiales bacterium]|nr:gamma carbonic anhydrase family protein [Acidimicrobiales bacterium]
MPLYALGDKEPSIHPEAYVHPDAVLIGAVTVGPESSIWPCAVLRGDDGTITVGARTSIQDGTVVHTTSMWPTVVGDDCVIGHNAHLEGCTIEDGALVGSGAVVLHRAVVRSEALVGANALVTNDTEVPSRAMALGVPAVIKEGRVDPEVMIQLGAQAYRDRVPRYRDQLRRLG